LSPTTFMRAAMQRVRACTPGSCAVRASRLSSPISSYLLGLVSPEMRVADGRVNGRTTDPPAPPPPSPPPPSPPLPSPPPPPHVAADWGGYTPVPAGATLPDSRMCSGYLSETQTSSTLNVCRSSCDASPTCMGFSWGLTAPPPPPPSASPPPAFINKRRALLAHDEPAVAGEVGLCFLMTSFPNTSSVVSNYTHAGCYAKGTRLYTWLVCRESKPAFFTHKLAPSRVGVA
jgi:hypothetical protein